jgi:6-phosphogluconolactonase (cycloisomerase 2 family)
MLTTLGPATATGAGPASAAFSPSGRQLVTADSRADTVTLFSVSTAGVLKQSNAYGTEGRPVAVMFSPNGRLVVAANGDGSSLTVFKVSGAGLELVGSLPIQGSPVSMSFSSTAPLLVVGTQDGLLVEFTVSDDGLAPLSAPLVSAGPFVAFSPDGTQLVAVSDSGWASAFSVSPAGVLSRQGLTTEIGTGVSSLAFDPRGGGFVVTNYIYGTVEMDAVSKDGAITRAGGGAIGLGAHAVAFSKRGVVAAVGWGGDGGVSAFSATPFPGSPAGGSTGGGALTYSGYSPATKAARAVAFSQDGGLLAAVDTVNNVVAIFAVSLRGGLTHVGSPLPTGSRPAAVAFRPGPGAPKLAVANYFSNSVSVFSAPPGGVPSQVGSPTLTSGQSPKALAFSSDGKLLATADEVGTSVTVFRVADNGGLSQASSTLAEDAPTSVAFSPTESLLAVGYATGSVTVYSVSSDGASVEPGSSISVGSAVDGISFDRDGRLLAAISAADDSLSLISVSEQGSELTRVGSPIETDDPASVAFSPTADLLAVASLHSAVIYAVEPGTDPTIRDFAQVDDPSSLAFSPNGKLLAIVSRTRDSVAVLSVSADGHVTQIGAMTPTGDDPSSVAFSSDGGLLAVASTGEGSVSVYPLGAPVLLASIASHPPLATRDTTATFTVDLNYVATLECSLDNAPFAPCEMLERYDEPPLQEGPHSFDVRATDLLGNVQAVPDRWEWEVDRTKPGAPVLDLPGDALSNQPTSMEFRWLASSDNAKVDHYDLVVDGSIAKTVPSTSCAVQCPTQLVASLGDGDHNWQVHAVDAADNSAQSPTRTFNVDAAPPAELVLAEPQDDVAITSQHPALSWHPTSDAGAGLAGYEVKIDDQVVASVGAPTTTFTPAAALAEGVHSWQILARDANDNRRPSTVRHLIVDRTPPVSRLIAAPNPVLADRAVRFDASGSTDGGSGIVRYEWDLDGDGSFERDTGSTATTIQTYPEPGTFGVQVRVTDRTGQSSTVRADERITVDSRSRGQLGVSINDGARYTNDPKVTISATWPSFASQMLMSNDGGFKAAQGFPLRAGTPWTLDSSGAERLPKIVYARFVRGLTVSETYTDDIILDQRPPYVASAQLTRTKGVALLRLRARDHGLAGLKAVQVTNDRRRPKARFRPYRAKLRLTRSKSERALRLGRAVFVRVRDRAGNMSSWRAAEQ